jgi:hypothetical protein
LRRKYDLNDDTVKINCELITGLGIEGSEQFEEVMVWARDEARKYVEKFTRLKEERANSGNEMVFLDTKKRQMERAWREEEKLCREAERKMKYAVQLYEASATKDLETVCSYMLTLEHKIKRTNLKKMRLTKELEFMRKQAELLHFTEAEVEERLRALDFAGMEDRKRVEAEDAVEVVAELQGDSSAQFADNTINVPPDDPDAALAKGQSASRLKERQEFANNLVGAE